MNISRGRVHVAQPGAHAQVRSTGYGGRTYATISGSGYRSREPDTDPSRGTEKSTRAVRTSYGSRTALPHSRPVGHMRTRKGQPSVSSRLQSAVRSSAPKEDASPVGYMGRITDTAMRTAASHAGAAGLNMGKRLARAAAPDAGHVRHGRVRVSRAAKSTRAVVKAAGRTATVAGTGSLGAARVAASLSDATNHGYQSATVAMEAGAKVAAGSAAWLATRPVRKLVKRATNRVGKAAAKLAVKVGKFLWRATVATARAIVSGLLALGGPVLLIIAAVMVIAMLLFSPFGILFDDENPDTPSLQMLTQNLDVELKTKIQSIIGSVQHDECDIAFVGSGSIDTTDNWMDVIAVFAADTTMAKETGASMDVIELDEKRQEKLHSVFFDMNQVSYDVEQQTRTSSHMENGVKVTETYTYRILHITVHVKSYEQMYTDYAFSQEKISITDELLDSPEFAELIAQITAGMSSGMQDGVAYNGPVPSSQFASEIVNLAYGKVGTPYGVMDCSKMVQTVFGQVGVSLPRTAAAQAKYCMDNGKTVSRSDLQPGDLVFWSLKGDNGRYMNVSHVGIYAGDGMVIDASTINQKTVYRSLFADSSQVLYGRP